MDSELLSQREFARRVGVSETLIRQKVKAGEIKKEKGKIPYLESKKIAIENGWAKLENVSLKHSEATNKNLIRAAGADENMTISQARLRHERAKAEKAEIELRVLKSELVEKTVVFSELYEFGQLFRSRLMQLSQRVVSQMRSASTNNEAKNILDEEIQTILEDISSMANGEGVELKPKEQ